MFFLFPFSLFNSILLVDALDALVLGVERGSDVGLGLVRHAHPLQGEVAALDEVVVHLMRETKKKKKEEVTLTVAVRRAEVPRTSTENVCPPASTCGSQREAPLLTLFFSFLFLFRPN